MVSYFHVDLVSVAVEVFGFVFPKIFHEYPELQSIFVPWARFCASLFLFLQPLTHSQRLLPSFPFRRLATCMWSFHHPVTYLLAGQIVQTKFTSLVSSFFSCFLFLFCGEGFAREGEIPRHPGLARGRLLCCTDYRRDNFTSHVFLRIYTRESGSWVHQHS